MTGWPWPLDSVQYWFEDLYRNIDDWITSGLDRLWDLIRPAFDTVGTWITSGLDSLWTTISTAFSDVSTWITDGFSAAWTSISAAFDAVNTWITDGLKGLWTAISDAVDWVQTRLEDWVRWLRTKIITWIQWLRTEISNRLTSLADSISTFLSDLWTNVSAAISAAVTSLVDSLTLAVGTIAGYVQDAITGVASAIGNALKALVDGLWSGVVTISSTIVNLLVSVRDAIGGTILSLVTGLVGTAGAQLLPGSPDEEVKKVSEDLFKNLMDKIKKIAPTEKKSPIPFEALMIAAGEVVASIMTTKVVAEAAGAALDAAHPMKDLKFKDIMTGVFGMFGFANVIGPILSQPVSTGILTPLQQHWNKTYTPYIPGSGDLINMMVREVISLPQFIENMALQGFSLFWAEAYYEVHWVLPAFGQLRDAMWRKIISPGEFGKYVVWHDYRPEPRPGIEKSDQNIMMALSYELPGRIDARWMFEQGVIKTEEHRKLTAMRGMLPEWVNRVTEAEERAAVRTEIEASVRRWAELTREGFLTGDELKSRIVDLGLGEKLAAFWVQRAMAEQTSRQLINEKNAILRAYETDRISRSECNAALIALGVTRDARARALRISDIKRIGKAYPTLEDLQFQLTGLEDKIAAQEAEVASRTAAVTEALTMETETLEVLDMEAVFAREDLAAAVEAEDVEKFTRRLALLLERRDVTASRLAASVRKAEDALSKARARLEGLVAERTSLEAEIRALGG